MPKQIHELTAYTGEVLSPEDLIVVSTATGNLTRKAQLALLPVQSVTPGAITRLLNQKISDIVSVKDYGARGDGITDDSTAFQTALDNHRNIFVPPGNYRLDFKVNIRPFCRIWGAGKDVTIITSIANYAFEFHRNSTTYQEDASALDDFTRTACAGMTFSMQQGGIRVNGNEFYAQDLNFKGGTPGSWCIEIERSNNSCLRNISGGFGGGLNALYANGIRWYATNDSDQQLIDYGNSLIEDVYLLGSYTNWVGIKTEHLSSSTTAGRIAGIHFNRVTCRAPVATSDPDGITTDATNGSAPWAYTGSTGLYLKSTIRCVFTDCDLQLTDYGLRMEGATTYLGAKATRQNVFSGLNTNNCAKPYTDNNGSVAGAVGRNFFVGGDKAGPIQPTGDDIAVTTTKAGRADTFLPGGMWMAGPVGGSPKVLFRCPDSDTAGTQKSQDTTLFITSPGLDAGRSDGYTLDDGHPRSRAPSRGIAFDFGSHLTTRIFRPVGTDQRLESRMDIGNGPDKNVIGGWHGPLKNVSILDPIANHNGIPWWKQPNNPFEGSIFYSNYRKALGTTQNWQGPGWYCYLMDQTESEYRTWVSVWALYVAWLDAGKPVNGSNQALASVGGAVLIDPRTSSAFGVTGGNPDFNLPSVTRNWTPAIVKQGMVRNREYVASSATTTATVDRTFFGGFYLVRHASNAYEFTIPAGLLNESESDPTTTGDLYRSACTMSFRRVLDGKVALIAGTNVTMYDDKGDAITRFEIRKGMTVHVLYRRTTSTPGGTATAEVHLSVQQARLNWTMDSSSTKTFSYTMQERDIGTIVRIDATTAKIFTVDGAVIPADNKIASVFVKRVGTGSVQIAPGTGGTMRTPGGADKLAAQNDIVQVIVERVSTGTYDVHVIGNLTT